MKCTRDVSTVYVLRSILICGVSVLYHLLFKIYENKRLCSLCSYNSHILIYCYQLLVSKDEDATGEIWII